MNAVVEKNADQALPLSAATPGALPVSTPSRVFSIVPQNLNEALQLAEMMAASELVPKAFRNKAADVFVAMQMGGEIGLSPMAAIQNIGVINGKPGLYGDAGKALLLAAGCIIEEDDTAIVQQNSRARCKITRRGRPPVERTFSVEDAKTAGLWNKEGPWRQYPHRQMAWRAFWFAARDAAADILKGLGGLEELADIPLVGSGSADPVTGAVSASAPSALPPYTDEQLNANLEAWGGLIAANKTTPERIIAKIKTVNTLTDSQENRILDLAAATAE